MTANIMQGRELVREGFAQSRNPISSTYWPIPVGWEQYLNEIFPATPAGGGWTYGGRSRASGAGQGL
jgi:hypothetical protein